MNNVHIFIVTNANWSLDLQELKIICKQGRLPVLYIPTVFKHLKINK